MTATVLMLVFAGGGLGALCRYGAGRLLARHYTGAFPLGTFLVNVTGCFGIGFVATLLASLRGDVTQLTALVSTGFLGGYTTFSTYALEGVLLYGDGERRLAVLSLVGSVLVGLAAAAAGATVGQAL
jgi:CrcB protein